MPLLHGLGPQPEPPALGMDRAPEGHRTVALGVTPVVPPRQNRRARWAYDRQLDKCLLNAGATLIQPT